MKKEYLVTDIHGKYVVVDHHSGFAVEKLIEIPEGSECLTKCGLEFVFWKDNGKFSWHTDNSSEWDNNIELELTTLSSYGKEYIVWQRHPENQNPLDDVKWFEGDLKVSNGYVVDDKCENNDVVNQPNHYANFSIECIDAMQAMLSKDEFVGYLRGNIFKYLWRYKLKNGVEDLKKAQWYQNKLIEVEENE